MHVSCRNVFFNGNIILRYVRVTHFLKCKYSFTRGLPTALLWRLQQYTSQHESVFTLIHCIRRFGFLDKLLFIYSWRYNMCVVAKLVLYYVNCIVCYWLKLIELGLMLCSIQNLIPELVIQKQVQRQTLSFYVWFVIMHHPMQFLVSTKQLYKQWSMYKWEYDYKC